MKDRRAAMRPGVRQAAICELVARRGEVSVDALAARFFTSRETIRRDLSVLADSGHLQKVYGGARHLIRQDEGAFEERMGCNVVAKRMIAEKIAKLVSPHQSLFIDTGSTTLICAEVLAKVRGLTVVTNSARIAASFSSGSGGAEVFLLGGRYSHDNAQTVGPVAIEEIRQFRADHVVLTIGAIDSAGVQDFSNSEAQIARSMIAASSNVIVTCDHTKFDRRATFSVCPLSEIDQLVVDRPPSGALQEALSQAGVEVIC